jgi:hypothetical protein
LTAGETVLIFNGTTLLGSAKVNNTAKAWTYTPSTPLNPCGPHTLVAMVVDAAGNTGPLSDPRSFVLDAPISTTKIDTLIGTGGPDIFLLPQLSWSLLGAPGNPAYDTIIGYQSTDRIQLSGRSLNTRLTSSAGVANSPAAPDIASTLTADWAANSARAFSINGFSGTFVALNDPQPGFQPERDGIIFLHEYTVSRSNPISLA